ncbi:hypothetical protein DP804_19485 [Salmonella enterica subsp. enterica]|nr:hypothetical protein [Salmonella enterica subsp. enterica serovar Virchow]
METRCPGGAGQRQLCWLCAEHDSPGSRQGSRPTPARPERKYPQQDEQAEEPKTEPYRREENTLTR